jgi:hypothetical protein
MQRHTLVLLLIAATLCLGGAAVADGQSHTKHKACLGSLAGCGYPSRSAHDVGETNCAALTAFNRSHLPRGTRLDGNNLLEVTRQAATLTHLDFPTNLTILIDARNVTVNHICAMTNGSATAGSTALKVAPGITGTTVKNSTLGGANTTNHSSEQAITNDANAPRTTATNDLLINCGECVHGTWKLTNSYVDAGATIPGDHYEDWYFSDGTISANHDVFINPHEQTAEIFGNTNGGNGGPADNHITITNSLLAGGGFMIYTNSSSTSVGTSTMNIAGNRFARCTTKADYNQQTGGESCAHGTDKYGIWPQGGYFGVVYPNGTYCHAPNHTWKNNTWGGASTVTCGLGAHSGEDAAPPAQPSA